MIRPEIGASNVQLRHEDHQPSGKTFPLSLLLEDVTDPANVGSVFRLADALGVRHVYLTGGTATPASAKVRRAARSTHQYVTWSYTEHALEVIEELQRRRVWVVSLELSSASVDVRGVQIAAGAEVLLVAGSENTGISAPVLAASAQTVHIPMLGQNSSMNVAVACALAVFEFTRHMSLD